MADMKKKLENDVPRIGPKEIRKVFRFHWSARRPFCLQGPPSTVKSVGVYEGCLEAAEKLGREFVDWIKAPIEKKYEVVANPKLYFIYCDLRAAETDVGDLRLQEMSNGKPFLEYKYNIVFKAFSHEESAGVLFLDEMNLAHTMTKSQFYKLINDRAIGDLPLAGQVLVVMAGNEAEHSRGISADGVPLTTRRANYFVRVPTPTEFEEFAVRAEFSPLVTGYLAFQPSHTHDLQYDLPDGIGQPCPRTWNMLSDLLKANEKMSLDEVYMVACGCVGPQVAAQFRAYVKSSQRINLKELIENPELFKQYDTEENLSLAYAVVAGVADLWRSDKKVFGAAMELVMMVRRDEFGAYMFRTMKAIDPEKFKKMGVEEKYKEIMMRVVGRYAKFLNEVSE